MKQRIIYFVFLCLTSFTLFSQNSPLISFQKKFTFTQDSLQKRWKQVKLPEMIVPIRYEVDLYEVIYYSNYPDGSKVKVSGWALVPKTEGKVSLISYNHGTQLKTANMRTPGEIFFCLWYAADGYAVLMTDYLGLGKGEKMHLYQHAESEAQASLDLIRAFRAMAPQIKTELNQQLFVAGYSQGGHAAMATTRMMQEKFPAEFPVTASAPMSGAYDMAGKQRDVVFKEYKYPFYLPYLIVSYQEAYHFYDGNILEVFKPPYDTVVKKGLYDLAYSTREFNDLLPKVPKDMLTDAFLKGFLEDTSFAFTKILRENGTCEWRPDCPMQLYYSKGDEQVSFTNTMSAYDCMRKNGAEKVKLRKVSNRFGHGTTYVFSIIYSKFWFDSFRKGSKRGHRGPLLKRALISTVKTKFKQ
ncbi:MAG: hypothetical protein K1X92_02340 [Bacteroidia bacterium]|nr:hypothetical protein [Bacteroidia bacterium]